MFDTLLKSTLEPGTNVCFSGGAKGADKMWGIMAEYIGHEVIHLCFAKHSYMGHDTKYRVDVPENRLEDALPHVRTANKSLKRKIPGPGYVRNLLCRNYYQILYAEAVYAVAPINHGYVQGGTAWAISMYLDKNPYNPKVYVFDMNTNQWYQYKHGTYECVDTVPKPKGRWAGIGSREITEWQQAQIAQWLLL